jgi:hypothetical protein
MFRKLLPLLLLAATTPASGQAEAPVVLKPLSVNLPDASATFPPGPSVDIANNNCLACHSVEMVLNQPTLPKVTWEAEIAKMRNVYKAPVADGDVAAIVEYLTAVKGPK